MRCGREKFNCKGRDRNVTTQWTPPLKRRCLVFGDQCSIIKRNNALDCPSAENLGRAAPFLKLGCQSCPDLFPRLAGVGLETLFGGVDLAFNTVHHSRFQIIELISNPIHDPRFHFADSRFHALKMRLQFAVHGVFSVAQSRCRFLI